jgi:hypothetical protein
MAEADGRGRLVNGGTRQVGAGAVRLFGSGDRAPWSVAAWNEPAVHLIDDFDLATVARAYVDVLPEMLPTARGWMRLLAIRQVNHDAARDLLVAAGRLARPSHRSALVGMLADLASEPEADGDADLASKARAALADLKGA